jgi:predicted Fe-S protein YdhL (DUF1289 family)
MAAIESPCVKVCTLDARAGVCLGCGRSIEEIERWTGMSAKQRAQVMAELPARLGRSAPDPRPADDRMMP